MKNFQKQLMTGLGLIRILRLLISLAVLYLSVSEENWLLGLLGAVLLFQVITNTGCGMGSCVVPPRRHFYSSTKDKHHAA